jgi:FkbM family methyltransferase
MLETILGLLKILPRGAFPIVHFLAHYSAELQHFPIKLKTTGDILYADLRHRIWFPIWKFGCYRHCLGEDKVVRDIIEEGDCVWDVGANIGYMALTFRHSVGEIGNVVCFEPSPTARTFLFESTRPYKNIEIVPKAVGKISGEVSFKERDQLDQSQCMNDGEIDCFVVPLISLDEEWDDRGNPNVDFIKVDVEGFDANVFEGASSVISNTRPNIMFEALSDKEYFKILELLKSYSNDYEFFRIHHDGTAKKPTKPSSSTGDGTHNYLALNNKSRKHTCVTF